MELDKVVKNIPFKIPESIGIALLEFQENVLKSLLNKYEFILRNNYLYIAWNEARSMLFKDTVSHTGV